jgi:hypothetical protein
MATRDAAYRPAGTATAGKAHREAIGCRPIPNTLRPTSRWSWRVRSHQRARSGSSLDAARPPASARSPCCRAPRRRHPHRPLCVPGRDNQHAQPLTASRCQSGRPSCAQRSRRRSRRGRLRLRVNASAHGASCSESRQERRWSVAASQPVRHERATLSGTDLYGGTLEATSGGNGPLAQEAPRR